MVSGWPRSRGRSRAASTKIRDSTTEIHSSAVSRHTDSAGFGEQSAAIQPDVGDGQRVAGHCRRQPLQPRPRRGAAGQRLPSPCQMRARRLSQATRGNDGGDSCPGRRDRSRRSSPYPSAHSRSARLKRSTSWLIGPTCWRSTRASRRRTRASTAGVSRSLPSGCAGCPSSPGRPRRRSETILTDVRDARRRPPSPPASRAPRSSTHGLSLTGRTGEGIRSLADTIREASAAAEQIAASAHQQSVGMDQIAEAMTNIDNRTGPVPGGRPPVPEGRRGPERALSGKLAALSIATGSEVPEPRRTSPSGIPDGLRADTSPGVRVSVRYGTIADPIAVIAHGRARGQRDPGRPPVQR